MRVSFPDLSSRLGGRKANTIFHALEWSFGVEILRLMPKDGESSFHKRRYFHLDEAVIRVEEYLNEPEKYFTKQQMKYLDSWEIMSEELKDLLEELEEIME